MQDYISDNLIPTLHRVWERAEQLAGEGGSPALALLQALIEVRRTGRLTGEQWETVADAAWGLRLPRNARPRNPSQADSPAE